MPKCMVIFYPEEKEKQAYQLKCGYKSEKRQSYGKEAKDGKTAKR